MKDRDAPDHHRSGEPALKARSLLQRLRQQAARCRELEERLARYEAGGGTFAGRVVALHEKLLAAVEGLYRSPRWMLAHPLHLLQSLLTPRSFHRPTCLPLQVALRESKTLAALAVPLRDRKGPVSAAPDAPLSLYDAFICNNHVTPRLHRLCRRAQERFASRPTISVLVPVHDVEVKWLRLAVESVVAQIYPRWELCLADDASTRPEVRAYLGTLTADPRIRLHLRPQRGGISAATNSAAALAEGEFIGLLDHDDVLAPNALFEIALLQQTQPEADVIYSDEDKIDERERRYDPQFKPDWSPELLLSYNYINHFTCLRRSLFDEIGGYREVCHGAQDYDLLLRATARTPRVHHIAKVLYHWRALPGSMAASPLNKSEYVHAAARQALEDHLATGGIPAKLYTPDFAEKARLPISLLDGPDTGPRVAILIPTRDRARLLRTCIESIRDLTEYRDYEIVVIDNESSERKTLSYLKHLAEEGMRIVPVRDDGRSFSFARICNVGAGAAEADLLLFLNNDTEITDPRWLSRLVAYAQLPGAGVVGARLLYPDGSVQHAGVVDGDSAGIAPGHAFLGLPAGESSYYFYAEVARNCTSVTGACLLTRRDLFLELGGFDEHYAVTCNDVDYCRRVRERGLRVVQAGGCALLHHESQTRNRLDDPAELARYRQLHPPPHDPYHNPNVSNARDWSVDPACHLEPAALFTRPLRVLVAGHNLNQNEGAPRALADVALGLKTRGLVEPVIFSPMPGALAAEYAAAGIPVRVQEMDTANPPLINQGWRSLQAYESSIALLARVLEQEAPDVVVSNTLFGYYVVDVAARAGIPSVWIIQESLDDDGLAGLIPEDLRATCERAFREAHAVIFASEDVRRQYDHLDARRNFTVIHNTLDLAVIDDYIAKTPRAAARRALGIEADRRMILSVGTVCHRKDQHRLVQAAALLAERRSDFTLHLVGGRDCPYNTGLREEIARRGLEEVVRWVAETPEVFPWLRAADVFTMASRSEAFSIAVLEAEAFGLPIVATHFSGIYAQMRGLVNGFVVPVGDAEGLARHWEQLLDNDALRTRMGAASRHLLDSLTTREEMLDRYWQLIAAAYAVGTPTRK